MLLRDDRFLRHGAKLREGMVEDIANICNYTRLTWERLNDIIVPDGDSWRDLRSESIRATLIGACYVEKESFSKLQEPPPGVIRRVMLLHMLPGLRIPPRRTCQQRTLLGAYLSASSSVCHGGTTPRHSRLSATRR